MPDFKPSRRQALVSMFVACLGPVAGVAQAQDYPGKPVTLVVPFSAGGSSDTLARSFARSLGTQLKQTVVVENRTGAGAPGVAVGASGLRGDPLADAVLQRRLAVEGRRDFQAHPRRAADHAAEESKVQLACFLSAGTYLYIEARRSQDFWRGLRRYLPVWDEMITEFNGRVAASS